MLQRVILLSLMLVGFWSVADLAQAQANTWPEYPFPGRHVIDRGPGGYLSWWKLLVVWLLMLFWIKTADWANRDCQTLRTTPYSIWNAVVVLPFAVSMMLSFLLPSFWISLPLLVLSSTVPLGIYIHQRNTEVDPHEKVLTPAHLRFLLSQALGKVGIKIRAEALAAHEMGLPVEFVPMGGPTPQQNQVNLINARQSEGFLPAKELFVDALNRRCEKVMLDFGRDSVAVKYHIDGVWHESDPREREAGDRLLEVYKLISGLDPKERRERQDGEFVAKYQGKKLPMKIFSQGTKTGERVIFQFVTDAISFKDLTELGMREKMQEQLRELLLRPNGLFLFSSVPAGGLTSTVYNTLKITDRYTRDFMSFQLPDQKELVAENVEVVIADGKGSPEDQLVSLFRREPNVVVVHQMTSGRMVEIMCQQAAKDKLVLSTIPAKEAVEALLRVLLLKVPPKVFAPVVFAVLNQRLLRKLCTECKQPYNPPPALLKKLGFPPGRIEYFYKPPEPEEVEGICDKCGGIGYFGRTAIYELLEVGPPLQDALMKEPKLESLRNLVRTAGQCGLHEEGLLLVARGVTSLAELTRMMKE